MFLEGWTFLQFVGLLILISTLTSGVAQIVRAFFRHRTPPAADPALARLEQRLQKLETTMAEVASEVGRIAEGQRFTVQVLSGQIAPPNAIPPIGAPVARAGAYDDER